MKKIVSAASRRSGAFYGLDKKMTGKLRTTTVKGVDHAVGSRIIYMCAAGLGITAQPVIAAKGYIKAHHDIVEAVAFVFRDGASALGLRVFVKMGLDGYYIIVIVDAQGLHPRVVGSKQENLTCPKIDGKHYGRDEHVARAWHGEPRAVDEALKPTKAFDPYTIKGGERHAGVRAEQFAGSAELVGRNEERHRPVDCS